MKGAFGHFYQKNAPKFYPLIKPNRCENAYQEYHFRLNVGIGGIHL